MDTHPFELVLAGGELFARRKLPEDSAVTLISAPPKPLEFSQRLPSRRQRRRRSRNLELPAAEGSHVLVMQVTGGVSDLSDLSEDDAPYR